MTIKLILLLAFPLCLLAQTEAVDLHAVQRIKNESFRNSQVMEYAFYLTDVYGPRLLGSANFKAAGDWAAEQFRLLGLSNVHQEKLPPLGRAWSLEHFTISQLTPFYAPLIGAPLAWSASTGGVIQADAVLVLVPQNPTAEDLATFVDQYKGKLRGKIILGDAPRPLPADSAAPFRRLTEEELRSEAAAPVPTPRPRPPAQSPRPQADTRNIARQLLQFLQDEGVLAWIVVNPLSGGPGINQGGIMTVTHALRDDPKDRRALPPMMILAAEHYNRIGRLLERKLPVRLELDISTKFSDEMPGAFNVIAEIPGAKKKDEIVMLGAHLDSWTGGTGATDNAAGVATVMEAMRILKTLELPMDRTVRVALWSAEEASALGSREYVRTHFENRDAAEYKEFCCYFNIDGGSGKVRGMFATNNDAARPVLKAWLAPFEDLGVTTVSPRNGGGSDHGAFDQAGLPGFDMLLDPLDYGSTTHHTNMDTYDRLRPGDLMHNAAVLASILYHAATREQPIPRKGVPSASAAH